MEQYLRRGWIFLLRFGLALVDHLREKMLQLAAHDSSKLLALLRLDPNQFPDDSSDAFQQILAKAEGVELEEELEKMREEEMKKLQDKLQAVREREQQMENEEDEDEDEGEGEDEDEDEEAADGGEGEEGLSITSDRDGIKTGEEEEDVLFSRRARMFRFNEEKNEWKERGLGELKLLQNRRTERIRILMRREETLKVCANHLVTPDLQLQPMAGTDKAWTYFTADYSGINEVGEYTGEVYTELFAFRFKDPQAAREWKEAVERCKAGDVAGFARKDAMLDRPKRKDEPDLVEDRQAGEEGPGGGLDFSSLRAAVDSQQQVSNGGGEGEVKLTSQLENPFFSLAPPKPPSSAPSWPDFNSSRVSDLNSVLNSSVFNPFRHLNSSQASFNPFAWQEPARPSRLSNPFAESGTGEGGWRCGRCWTTNGNSSSCVICRAPKQEDKAEEFEALLEQKPGSWGFGTKTIPAQEEEDESEEETNESEE
eukprot:759508-Hanusia_phi.AAC.1